MGYVKTETVINLLQRKFGERWEAMPELAKRQYEQTLRNELRKQLGHAPTGLLQPILDPPAFNKHKDQPLTPAQVQAYKLLDVEDNQFTPAERLGLAKQLVAQRLANQALKLTVDSKEFKHLDVMEENYISNASKVLKTYLAYTPYQFKLDLTQSQEQLISLPTQNKQVVVFDGNKLNTVNPKDLYNQLDSCEQSSVDELLDIQKQKRQLYQKHYQQLMENQ